MSSLLLQETARVNFRDVVYEQITTWYDISRGNFIPFNEITVDKFQLLGASLSLNFYMTSVRKQDN